METEPFFPGRVLLSDHPYHKDVLHVSQQSLCFVIYITVNINDIVSVFTLALVQHVGNVYFFVSEYFRYLPDDGGDVFVCYQYALRCGLSQETIGEIYGIDQVSTLQKFAQLVHGHAGAIFFRLWC